MEKIYITHFEKGYCTEQEFIRIMEISDWKTAVCHDDIADIVDLEKTMLNYCFTVENELYDAYHGILAVKRENGDIEFNNIGEFLSEHGYY